MINFKIIITLILITSSQVSLAIINGLPLNDQEKRLLKNIIKIQFIVLPFENIDDLSHTNWGLERSSCSAIVYDQNTIISAKHCVEKLVRSSHIMISADSELFGRNVEGIYVEIDHIHQTLYNLYVPEKDYFLRAKKRSRKHLNFSEFNKDLERDFFGHDLAVIKTKFPLKSYDSGFDQITPVEIVRVDDVLTHKNNYIILGYGLTSVKGDNKQTQSRKITLKKCPIGLSFTYDGKKRLISETNSPNRPVSCSLYSGDSGGPVLRIHNNKIYLAAINTAIFTYETKTNVLVSSHHVTHSMYSGFDFQNYCWLDWTLQQTDLKSGCHRSAWMSPDQKAMYRGITMHPNQYRMQKMLKEQDFQERRDHIFRSSRNYQMNIHKKTDDCDSEPHKVIKKEDNLFIINTEETDTSKTRVLKNWKQKSRWRYMSSYHKTYAVLSYHGNNTEVLFVFRPFTTELEYIIVVEGNNLIHKFQPNVH